MDIVSILRVFRHNEEDRTLSDLVIGIEVFLAIGKWQY